MQPAVSGRVSALGRCGYPCSLLHFLLFFLVLATAVIRAIARTLFFFTVATGDVVQKGFVDEGNLFLLCLLLHVFLR